MKQSTVKTTQSWEGIGLHTGKLCRVTVESQLDNKGITFIDLDNSPHEIRAIAKNIVSTNRSTVLSARDSRIMTIEHLMAALHAHGITQAKITVQGGEIPILDGSSQDFYERLEPMEIEHSIDAFGITEPLHFNDSESQASYTLLPSDHLTVEVVIDYDPDPYGQPYARYDQLTDDFLPFARSRTFTYTGEIVALAEAGLIKGGSLENAVVFPSHHINRKQFGEALQHLQIDESEKIIDQVFDGIPLQYDNEPARHKVLDLLGDLALLGMPIHAHIIAHQPGHSGNVALVKFLNKKYLEKLKLAGVPDYDPISEPVYNTEQIKGFLPHRYPFLLVDKIIKLTDSEVVGVKNITFNENYFMGHFPGNPIFPGVLQMEALAQTGGLLALNTIDNPSDYDTYFLKMDQVKFKRKVLPGDTLLLKMELLAPIRRGIVQMKGTTYVGSQVASEGILTAQIVDRTKLR